MRKWILSTMVDDKSGEHECGDVWDIDGDKDLVSGKRFMAHNGELDPDEYGPLGVYWYELAGRNPVAWKKHTRSYGLKNTYGKGNILCHIRKS